MTQDLTIAAARALDAALDAAEAALTPEAPPEQLAEAVRALCQAARAALDEAPA